MENLDQLLSKYCLFPIPFNLLNVVMGLGEEIDNKVSALIPYKYAIKFVQNRESGIIEMGLLNFRILFDKESTIEVDGEEYLEFILEGELNEVQKSALGWMHKITK